MDLPFLTRCAYSNQPGFFEGLSSHPQVLNYYSSIKLSLILNFKLKYDPEVDYASIIGNKIHVPSLASHDYGIETPRVLQLIYEGLYQEFFPFRVLNDNFHPLPYQFLAGTVRNPNSAALEWLKGLDLNSDDLDHILEEVCQIDNNILLEYFILRLIRGNDYATSLMVGIWLRHLLERNNLSGIRLVDKYFPLRYYVTLTINLENLRSLEAINLLGELLNKSPRTLGRYIIDQGHYSDFQGNPVTWETIRLHLKVLKISPQELLEIGGTSFPPEVFENLLMILKTLKKTPKELLGSLLVSLLCEGEEMEKNIELLLQYYPNVKEDYEITDKYPLPLDSTFHLMHFKTNLRARAFLDLYIGRTSFKYKDLEYFFKLPSSGNAYAWTVFYDFPLLEELFRRYPQAFELLTNIDIFIKAYVQVLNVYSGFSEVDGILSKSLRFLFEKVTGFKGLSERINEVFKKTSNYRGSTMEKTVLEFLEGGHKLASF